MTLTKDDLATAPVGPTADLLASKIAEFAGLDHAHDRADDLLTTLTGTDDQPGAFDRYEIRASVLGNGKPLIVWYCPACHHVGMIARDMDGDQTNLTLGEISQAVLDHERDDH